MGSPSDSLLEVWIESFEHDLLFSRRSSVYDKKWTGASDLTDDEIDRISDEVDDHVCDRARFSYRMEEVMDEE